MTYTGKDYTATSSAIQQPTLVAPVQERRVPRCHKEVQSFAKGFQLGYRQSRLATQKNMFHPWIFAPQNLVLVWYKQWKVRKGCLERFPHGRSQGYSDLP